jgi:ornithine decarboxylase
LTRLDPFAPDQIQRLVREFGSPLLILDCARVRARLRRLRPALRGVELHYALAALPHAAVVRALRQERVGFDVSTTSELQLVQALGVEPEYCIHTHPIKYERDIRNALAFGISTFTADNGEEVRKFKRYRERAALMLRVACRSCSPACARPAKFGCDPEDTLELARLAASLGIDVRGLSFHIESPSIDALEHAEAAHACTQLLVAARRERLGSLDTLHIGGGFAIDYAERRPDSKRVCAPLRTALVRLPRRVRVLAEAGRYLLGPAAVAVATVVGRARRGEDWWYYLDGGLYGSYRGLVCDHAPYPMEALRQGTPLLPSVLAGPSCDSSDIVAAKLMLPQLKAGDLIIARAVGANTGASASALNCSSKAALVAVNREPGDRGGVEPSPI